jgi:hypothetical protein
MELRSAVGKLVVAPVELEGRCIEVLRYTR